MEQLLIIIIIAFFVFRLISRSPKYKGASGEKKVAGKLEKLIDQIEGARIFHNLILETPDGSTQIDHLVLSTTGIFVIETKNMSGWIFGGDKQRMWTQTIYMKKQNFKILSTKIISMSRRFSVFCLRIQESYLMWLCSLVMPILKQLCRQMWLK
jgi:hypothetical protein